VEIKYTPFGKRTGEAIVLGRLKMIKLLLWTILVIISIIGFVLESRS